MELLTSTSAEQFQQCAEFPPLRNRGLGPLAVTKLPGKMGSFIVLLPAVVASNPARTGNAAPKPH